MLNQFSQIVDCWINQKPKREVKPTISQQQNSKPRAYKSTSSSEIRFLQPDNYKNISKYVS